MLRLKTHEKRLLAEPPPSRAELDALLREYKQLAAEHGVQSKQALSVRNRIVTSNLRLAWRFAERVRHVPKGWTAGDFLSLGSLGVAKAVERFDPDLGYAFSTYATWWIRHEIQRGMADTGATVRVPVHAQGAASTATASVREAASAAMHVYSLDERVAADDGQGMARLDLLADERAPVADEALASAECAAFVHGALASELNGRQRVVIAQRLAGRKLEDIGEELGLSRERVRQVELEAHAKIRRLVVA